MLSKSGLSLAVSAIFLVSLVLFLVIYMRDQEYSQERPQEDSNWIVGFLVILVLGLLVSLWLAYRSYGKTYLSECIPKKFSRI